LKGRRGVCYDDAVPTDRRIQRVTSVLDRRQPDLRVVLEGVAIAHNASAVLRTCDAAGVPDVDIISPNPDVLVFNKAISTRADKWVRIRVHASASDCLAGIRAEGFLIAATHLGEGAVPYREVDYTRPIAIVFGSESEGISAEALALSDLRIRIPMVGMVQSLNLSVSVGIVLYEAFHQRQAKGLFGRKRLPPGRYDALFKDWLGIDPGPEGKPD
jgi:tRNA (guanosine-2'-O-)-methyltransferase